MAKIYYLGGSTSSNGILRSIPTGSLLSGLLRSHTFVYVGATFPAEARGAPATILEISQDEQSDGWDAGFYRAKLPPLEFEEMLRDLESAPAVQAS